MDDRKRDRLDEILDGDTPPSVDIDPAVIRAEREAEEAEIRISIRPSDFHEYRRQFCETCRLATLQAETPTGLYSCTVCGSENAFGSRTF